MPIESIPLQTVDYAAVAQQDADDDDDPVPQATLPTRLNSSRSNKFSPWIAHALLALVNAFTFLYLLQKTPNEAVCRKVLDDWSPVTAANAVHYKTIPIDGNITQLNQYRGAPSSDIDTAWANITTVVPPLRLAAHDLAPLKKSPDIISHAAEGEGGGFKAQLEVYELLACLDTLRRATYKQQYYPDLQLNSEGFYEADWHTRMDHCVDMLRVDLMCKSDVSVLTYTKETGLVDFSAVKKCRDFDEILEWSRSQQK